MERMNGDLKRSGATLRTGTTGCTETAFVDLGAKTQNTHVSSKSIFFPRNPTNYKQSIDKIPCPPFPLRIKADGLILAEDIPGFAEGTQDFVAGTQTNAPLASADYDPVQTPSDFPSPQS